MGKLLVNVGYRRFPPHLFTQSLAYPMQEEVFFQAVPGGPTMNEIFGKKVAGTEPDIFWGEIAPCDHVLQLYDNDEEFISTLEGFASSGFRCGESVVVIATPEHLRALNQRLRDRGWDLFSLTLQDQYIPLSAQDTLGQFMINGWPDENLFYHLLTNLLLRARSRERRVRAFGEMVAILWSEGYSGATVHLEHLWSRYCESERFKLFCAYPKSGFTEDARTSLDSICRCHSKTIAANDQGHPALVTGNLLASRMASGA